MEHSLSGFGLKGGGVVAVLSIIGVMLVKFFATDDILYDLGITAIFASILLGIMIGIMEIAERYKKFKDPFN